jgi:DNA ligase (NAD+)
MNASERDILEIDGIGQMTADCILQYMSSPSNVAYISELLQYITISEHKNERLGDRDCVLYEKTIVFTGKLSNVSRSYAKQVATSCGATVASCVSNKTDYVILGENAGSKLRRAQELGIAVLTEEEFLQYAGKA